LETHIELHISINIFGDAGAPRSPGTKVLKTSGACGVEKYAYPRQETHEPLNQSEFLN
jgi:hypothetical protein